MRRCIVILSRTAIPFRFHAVFASVNCMVVECVRL